MLPFSALPYREFYYRCSWPQQHIAAKNYRLAAQLSSAYANLPHLLARRRGVVLALVRCRESRVVESGAWVAAVARLESRLLGLR